jgi:hypothetical protein
MDPHPIPDRAQSETDPQPAMAGRITGLIGNRGRGSLPTAGCRTTRSRRAGEAGRIDSQGRGRAEASRGGSESRDTRKRQGDPRPRNIYSNFHYRRLHRRWWTSWTWSQSERIDWWSSWQRNRARAARKRQGLNVRGLGTTQMSNVFEIQPVQALELLEILLVGLLDELRA